MVTITNAKGISLSANAAINNAELGLVPVATYRGRGDFAARVGGRIRRQDRRNAIARKRAWLEG
jgi:hypothetical protein